MSHTLRIAGLSCAVAAGLAGPLAAQRFSPPRTDWDSMLVAQATAAHVDYAKAYEQANARVPAGLDVLFGFSLRVTGRAAIRHAAVLRDLADLWGDSAFAAVLRPQPDSVRLQVRCALDFATCSRVGQTYPIISTLAPYQPRCMCVTF
jgi:hypothetical protein